ncbi:hypothetical protein AB1Y20_012927 [Prymnesium parvum]|uniref:Sacsin/Nov domain-containing protein n=1 Tax=Prymnesium parvum TaxID=97485 RepID=A0AB34IJ84_PRYPA
MAGEVADACDEEGISDFGQKVDLCQRIRDVLVNYPEGAILKEMVQNADDAGATTFRVLLDCRTHPSSTLLGPALAAFQGPALLTYNDAVFTDTDFQSIQHIGGSRKTESEARTKTGRFGVGFNSSYHVTDLPCFVSRRYMVMLDPHCAHLPNVNHAEPGKMINFLKPGMRERLSDQFAPFLVFDWDMSTELNGTLFRLPLRTAKQAETSRISKCECSIKDAECLMREFGEVMNEAALFLTHIHTLEIAVWREGEPDASTIRRLQVRDPERQILRRQRLHELVKEARHDMSVVPSEEHCMELHMETAGQNGVEYEQWLVVQCMGSGKARDMSMSADFQAHGLQPVPWAGIATRISPNKEGHYHVKGRPYCLLPLPATTGLPVHVNGFFELSSNRRDIWYGDDMVGAGRLRAEWNSCLIQDVVAPSYMRLLLQVRDRLREASGCYGDVAGYYALWPQSRPPEPWGGLVDVLYQLLLQQPMLYSEMHDGVWVSPAGAVFAMHLKHEAEKARAMDNALLRSGMPLVRVPDSVAQLLEAAAKQQFTELRWADPPMVRTWLAAQREWEAALTRIEGMELLEYCLLELDEDVSSLFGLQLLPLVDTSWGRFDAAESGSPPLLLSSSGDRPLLSHRPSLLVEVDLSSPVGQQLARVAAGGQTNLRLFSAELLPSLLPFLLPASWRGLEVVDLTPTVEARTGVGSDGAEPSCSWLLQLWEFIGRHHSKVQLGDLLGWPLLPVEGELQAYALPSGGLQLSRMVDFKDMDLSWASCLRKAGCLSLHHGVRQAHPQLQRVVHEVSACGVLRALRVAAGGPGVSSPQDLSQSVSRLFERVERHERQSLRAMLAERRHVEMSALRSDKDLLAMLGWLPVYEVHLSVSHEDEAQRAAVESVAAEQEESRNNVEGELVFTALDLNQHRLAPSGVSATLLDERFVCYTNESELELLQLAGLVRLDRSRFFRDYIFPRLPVLPVSARDSAMLSVLHGLHGLCAEDSTFLEALRELSFVPVQSGLLRRPDELFHPKVSEASELLDKSEVHPSGAFADESVLGVLERLGLRVQVTRDAVLQSARSIEALCPIDSEAAVRRAKALLQYVDVHADRIIGSAAPATNRKKASWLKAALGSSARPSHSKVRDVECNMDELARIVWLPVLTRRPEPFVPWNEANSHAPLASASETRPVSELWLVSFKCRLLDGEVRSLSLRNFLGWTTPPNFFVMAEQLASLSLAYPDVDQLAYQRCMVLAIPSLYKGLDSSLDGSEDETDEMRDVRRAI